MKISKSVLKSVAVAVAITTVTSSCSDLLVKPNGEKTAKNKKIDYCPACGMG